MAGDAVTIVIDEAPEHGELVASFGQRFYEPDTGYEGTDSFSYHAESVNGSSSVVTQQLTISPTANTAPFCPALAFNVKPGNQRQLDLTFCSDVDGDPLEFEVATQPEHGTVVQGSSPRAFTYTAPAGYLGPDPFELTVDDGHGGVVDLPVSITVTTANAAPTCFGIGLTAQWARHRGQRIPVHRPRRRHADLRDRRPARPRRDHRAGRQPLLHGGRRLRRPRLVHVPRLRRHGVLRDADREHRGRGCGRADLPEQQPLAGGRRDARRRPRLLRRCRRPGAGDPGPAARRGRHARAHRPGQRPGPVHARAGLPGQTSFTFVASSGGQTSAPATITIQVRNQGFGPQVFVGASTNHPRTGETVTFTSTASDPDGGSIVDYEWFVDGASVESGAGASTLERSFATPGPHAVKLVVTDDEGDESSHTLNLTAHDGNVAPEVWLFAPGKVGTGVPVRLEAYGFDRDGEIAEYSWSFGDGSPVQSGAGLDSVQHTYTTPGTKTVSVTVKDDEGATKTDTRTITVTDENTAPALDVYWSPFPAQRDRPLTVYVDPADAEGDAITLYEWDLDGNGSFETGGGDAAEIRHEFAEIGTYSVGVRVTDARGAKGVKTVAIKVVNSPPAAVIEGPRVIDIGSTATYTDASTDDGSIASRAWDTDNDGAFDDGTGATVDLPAGPTPRFKVIRLRVTDGEGESTVAVRQITVRNPGPVVIDDPVVPPLPGGGTVNVGTTTDPTTGQTTITLPQGQVGQFPNACMPLDVNVLIRKAAGATVVDPLLVITRPGGGVERVPMTDANGDGIWTAHLDCAVAGTLRVEYTIRNGDGSEEEFDIPAGTIVLIDPQGVVYDRAAYAAHRAANPGASEDESRAAAAIEGATVHLQRQVAGDWVDVSASDPGIDPNVNPQITGANGLYKWDVIDGTYRVRVSAPGFRSRTSHPVVIPPPVLDLHMAMERNQAPTAAIDAADEAVRGQQVTFTADADDDREVSELRWDLDGDGDFDDATGTTASRTFTSLGEKTVRVQAADDEGERTVAETAVVILNRAPTVSAIGGPAEGFRGDGLTFTATGADPDPGATVTLTWDVDGDGFDDGTGASKTTTFSSLGAKTVRVRASDGDGGTAASQKAVTILNRVPIAGFTFSPAEPVADQQVAFTSTAADPDPGTTLQHAWDLDGDGQYDDATGASASRAFALGSHTVGLRVDDGDGQAVTVTRVFAVRAKPDDGGGTGGGGGETGGGGTGGGGTGGGAGGTGGGGGTPADTQAPTVTLTAARGQRLKAVLAKGLKLTLQVGEPGTVKVQLLVDKATARKLKLDKKAKKPVVTGTFSRALAAGKATVAVKLTAKARKALKRAKSLRVDVAVEARDAAGNVARKTARLTLKKWASADPGGERR